MRGLIPPPPRTFTLSTQPSMHLQNLYLQVSIFTCIVYKLFYAYMRIFNSIWNTICTILFPAKIPCAVFKLCNLWHNGAGIFKGLSFQKHEISEKTKSTHRNFPLLRKQIWVIKSLLLAIYTTPVTTTLRTNHISILLCFLKVFMHDLHVM